MSRFTESSDNDTPALTYHVQAINAFEQGELEYSEELCRKAAKLYERAGKDEVSGVYGQLGLIAYWQRDLDAAERWYRKALDIALDLLLASEDGFRCYCDGIRLL